MKLGSAMSAAERGGAHSIHVDVMDGHYVANLAFSPKVVADLRSATTLPVHVHLEVANPAVCIDLFAGADLIIVQEDTCQDLAATIEQIVVVGAGVGVAVNPDRPIEILEPWLGMLDLLLVMAVWPGFGGQRFDASVLAKATWAWEQRRAKGLGYAIGLDGGVKVETVGAAAAAGVDYFIAGTGVFTPIPSLPADQAITASIARLRKLAEEYQRPD